VRGIIPRTSLPEQLVDGLRRVGSGELQVGFGYSAGMGQPRRGVSLTPREREIVSNLKRGIRNKQIATEMGITEGTVKIYLFRLFQKLGVRSRFELARYGIQDDAGTAPENGARDRSARPGPPFAHDLV